MMNLRDLKELRDKKAEQAEESRAVLKKAKKALSKEEQSMLSDVLEEGYTELMWQVKELDEMIEHVEEMMTGVQSDTISRGEVEKLVILSIDLWDAPF